MTSPGRSVVRILCKRLVLVRPDPYPDDEHAIEIITSYGLYVGEVPL